MSVRSHGEELSAQLRPDRKNLVLVRAGRRSLHASWLRHGDPDFDLVVVAYEPVGDELLAGALHSMVIPGPKVHGLSLFFAGHWDLVRSYDAIAIIDDDILANAADINACFETGAAYDLKLWQPSLTSDSFFSHGITVSNKIFRLRYTNFVEMMCPFFSYQHLEECRFSFELGLESGIDQLWCRVGGLKDFGCAVLDSVAVKHTRKVGQLRADQGFVGEYSDYLSYIEAAKSAVNYTFSGAVSYAAVLRNGATIRNRMLIAALSAYPIVDYPKAVDKTWFVRPLVNHCGRNLLTEVDRTNVKDGMVLGANALGRTRPV